MQDNKETKHFLLLAPRDFDLYKLIKKNLEYLGYEVTVVHNDGYVFRYTSFIQRVINFLRKVFLVDYNYKHKLRQTFQQRHQEALLDKIAHYDVGLAIRADFFSLDLLLAAREKSRKFIAYHYDGLARSPKIFQRIYLFDRFYVFDHKDVQKYTRLHLHHAFNFYFDYPDEPAVLNDGEQMTKIHYISSFHPTRMDQMIDFHKKMKSIVAPIQFDLVYNHYDEGNVPAYAKHNFNCIRYIIPFEQQLSSIQRSDIILDFCIADHKGLSFRVFEGMKYGKKVITTNETILDQEFYHPNNFFLLQTDNYSDIPEFLERPYVSTPPDIRKKYGFSSWLNKLIDYEPEASPLKSPLISIIIPCYNIERVILDAIDSALEQSYPNIEVIVVDDGSSDHSREKVADYIKDKPKVRLIQQENSGPSVARNRGFDYSNGEFVVFLDGDDKLHRSYLTECYQIFRKMPNITIVYSAAELFENETGIWDIEAYQRENILINNSIPIYAMVRSSVFEEVGRFDTDLRYAEDWELWIRVLQKYDGVHRIPKALYYYRKRLEKSSLTDKNKEGKIHDMYYEYIYDKHRDFYVDNGLSLRALLTSFKLIRTGEVTDKYRKKYYNVWYRKLFYYLFKRRNFRKIYRENIL